MDRSLHSHLRQQEKKQPIFPNISHYARPKFDLKRTSISLMTDALFDNDAETDATDAKGTKSGK
jgi:hypothetical protein